MDSSQARVYHRGYSIDLFGIEYDILVTTEDIEFAAMTVDMMHKGLDLDTGDIVGKTTYAMKISHPDVGFRLFGLLNLDLDKQDSLENTIDLMGDITKLSTKLSWFMLEVLEIKIDEYNNNLHGLIVSQIFKDIYSFIESVLDDGEKEEDDNSDSDINDL